MSEEQIINAIANACEDDTLCFQIIIDDSTLHVYINRQDLAEPNYQQLKEKIYTAAISLHPLEFKRIWLYCRILGKVEPDWQSLLEVDTISLTSEQIAPMMESITTAVEATNSIVEKIEQELYSIETFAEDSYWEIDDLPTTADDSKETDTESELIVPTLDLSKYCFIRNQRLLYAVLPAPDNSIACLIDTFNSFDSSIKRSQLPILEVYFEQSILIDIDSFNLEVQTWWTKIKQLDSESSRMLAIWLSRYCLNPKETLIIIKEVFKDHSDTIKDKKSSPKIAPSFSFDSSTTQSSSDPILQPEKPQVKSGLISNLMSFLGRLFQSD